MMDLVCVFHVDPKVWKDFRQPFSLRRGGKCSNKQNTEVSVVSFACKWVFPNIKR